MVVSNICVMRKHQITDGSNLIAESWQFVASMVEIDVERSVMVHFRVKHSCDGYPFDGYDFTPFPGCV